VDVSFGADTCQDKGETCLVGHTTGWDGWDCARAANQAADSDGTDYCTTELLAGDGTAMQAHMADCCPATCGVCSAASETVYAEAPGQERVPRT